ncbi:MAG: long-chain fatty acid--CoA ligase [Bacteroidales bacterium]|nr:long-chain fatty acid--CoA ligase [Bacteroidales bacterium]
MTITRTFDLLSNLKASFPPKDDILAHKVDGRWIKHSIDDYIEHSHNVAYGLLALGYKAGTKIITLCNNRPEWNFVDMGSNLAHMIHVPVYSTLSKQDFLHIFDHSDAEIIVVGTQKLYEKIAPIIAEIDRDFKVILMDDSEEMFSISKLEALGREHKEQFEPVVERNKAEISPDDCCSIVYTSGTTGLPKGVMLSHRNLVFNSHGHAVRQVWNWNHKMLSFLPLCHVYERTMNYEFQELAISIYYAESLSTVARDLADCKADGFCSVPRVLEIMYGKLEAAGKRLKGIKRFIYKRAWKFANNFDFYNKNRIYLARRKLHDKLVYSKWREALGGKEMIIVSGGSSIQAKIVRAFNAANLHIYEGYGMTETSPVIAVNSPADGINVIGTVGKALGGTELAFAEDGEILTRGPHVMLGYYKDPEATAEIIDEDGWLHTGDVGYLVDGQYLKITDRKKEIFKLSIGKYVAPQVIETRLKESPYIDNCIVVGDNQKFASAIIIPSLSKTKEYADKRKIEYGSDEELIAKEEIVKLIHSEVNKVNKSLAAHEAIKRERLVIDEWTPQNDMVSQTLKLKRRNVHKKYANLINEIFRTE